MGIRNRIVEGDGDTRHGYLSTYTNHDCRCPACKAAHSAYMAEYKARRVGA